MAENLMNSAHKASTEKYRSEYDRIFRPSPLISTTDLNKTPDAIAKGATGAGLRYKKNQKALDDGFAMLDNDYEPPGEDL